MHKVQFASSCHVKITYAMSHKCDKTNIASSTDQETGITPT